LKPYNLLVSNGISAAM